MYIGLCEKILEGEFKTGRISLGPLKGVNTTGRIQSCLQYSDRIVLQRLYHIWNKTCLTAFKYMFLVFENKRFFKDSVETFSFSDISSTKFEIFEIYENIYMYKETAPLTKYTN